MAFVDIFAEWKSAQPPAILPAKSCVNDHCLPRGSHGAGIRGSK